MLSNSKLLSNCLTWIVFSVSVILKIIRYFSMSEQFKRPSWDEYFMLQAELAKLRSNCITRQVGAVIAREHRQLATGYNGTPPGIKNC